MTSTAAFASMPLATAPITAPVPISTNSIVPSNSAVYARMFEPEAISSKPSSKSFIADSLRFARRAQLEA